MAGAGESRFVASSASLAGQERSPDQGSALSWVSSEADRRSVTR